MNRLPTRRAQHELVPTRPVLVLAMVAVLVVPAIPDLDTFTGLFSRLSDALQLSASLLPDAGLLLCLAGGLLILDTGCLALRGRSPLANRSGRLIALRGTSLPARRGPLAMPMRLSRGFGRRRHHRA